MPPGRSERVFWVKPVGGSDSDTEAKTEEKEKKKKQKEEKGEEKGEGEKEGRKQGKNKLGQVLAQLEFFFRSRGFNNKCANFVRLVVRPSVLLSSGRPSVRLSNP